MPRRHLPVLNPPASAPPTVSEVPEEAPPWHWIPLGTVVSVMAFAFLAQGAAALSVWILARVYPPGSSAARLAAIRATRGASAVATEVLAGAVPLVALLASIALGSFVVGRYGGRTHERHGTLSGLCTGGLFWAVTGRLTTFLLLLPLMAAVGWLAARAGRAVREGRAISSPWR